MPKLELEVPELEDFKEDIRLKSCLNYVIKNFREVEPILREHWIKKEMKQLKETKKAEDKER